MPGTDEQLEGAGAQEQEELVYSGDSDGSSSGSAHRVVVIVGFAILLILLCCFVGPTLLHSGNQDTITLSASEKAQAIAIAEARQQLQFDRQAALNEFDRRERELDLRSAKLCYELKKAHQINPQVQYWLDEWRGVLRKVEAYVPPDDPRDQRRQLKETHVLRQP